MIQLAPECLAWPGLDDRQLMSLVCCDSQDAFTELHRRFSRRIYGLLQKHLGARPAVEDLVQEVFLRIHRARKRYQPTAELHSWIFTITVNVALNAKRAEARRRESPLDELSEVHPSGNVSPSPLDELLASEERMQVRAAIKRLNPRQAKALELNRIQGLSYAEVAAQLEMTPDAVKSLLARARKNLSAELNVYRNR